MRAGKLGLWAIGICIALSAAAACGSDGGGDGDGDGDGDGSGDGNASGDDGKNTTGGCVNEACDASSSSGQSGACPNAGLITYPMSQSAGPSMCQGAGPDECGVVNQDDCEVTVECTGFPPLTLTIDSEGVSNEVSVPIGDGVVATCHIEVSTTALALTLACSAQGVTCEWAGSYP